jgi:broad specificity phosphatase PhoE
MTPNSDEPRQLILVRHAETQANVESRWQGQRQEGVLTPRGQRQIERVAQRLSREKNRIAAIYTSPLVRARATAKGIGAAVGQDPIVKENLTEMDFGDLDSWTMPEIAEERPEFFAAWRDFADSELTWPGGESRRDFWDRVTTGWNQILTRHPQDTIVIVAHGGSLRVGIGHLLDWPPTVFFSYNLDNCSLSRVVYEYERWRLLTLNDTCHLDSLID